MSKSNFYGCPVCGGKTIASSTMALVDHTLRTRKCQVCGYAFSTIELDKDMVDNAFNAGIKNPKERRRRLKRLRRELLNDECDG